MESVPPAGVSKSPNKRSPGQEACVGGVGSFRGHYALCMMHVVICVFFLHVLAHMGQILELLD